MQSDNRNNVKRVMTQNAFGLLANKYGDKYINYRNEWEESLKKQQKTEKPLQLSLEMTSFCNLQCKMCYMNGLTETTREFISLELVDEIVKQAKELKIPGLWLGLMTESLLHPEANTIIRKFAEVGAMDYWYSTNGTLLTPDIAEALIDAQVTVLTVSLDAATPETYRHIRGADLDKVKNNIMKFIELREKRQSDLPRLRVSFVEIPESSKIGRGNLHEKELFSEEWKNIADIIDFQKMLDNSPKYDKTREELLRNSNFHCSDPFSRIVVKHDGEMLPCCNPYYSGCKQNIKDISLMDFWNSAELENVRHSVKTKNFPSACKYCSAVLST